MHESVYACMCVYIYIYICMHVCASKLYLAYMILGASVEWEILSFW